MAVTTSFGNTTKMISYANTAQAILKEELPMWQYKFRNRVAKGKQKDYRDNSVAAQNYKW